MSSNIVCHDQSSSATRLVEFIPCNNLLSGDVEVIAQAHGNGFGAELLAKLWHLVILCG